MFTKLKIFFLLIIYICINYIIYAQPYSSLQEKIVLTQDNAEWIKAVGGKTAAPPQKTSYGFTVLTEGRILYGFSKEGLKLWEKNISGKPQPFLTAFSKDFLLIVSNKNILNLINPSGLILWSKKSDFEIIHPPYAGRDGRIFIIGKNNIACYGINGICKWIIDTPELNEIPFSELNDGTLLIFSDGKNDKTSAFRITPFGEIADSFNFSGKIINTLSCNDGVFIIFSEGTAEMCSIKYNKVYTKWISCEKIFSSCEKIENVNLINLNQEIICALPFKNKMCISVLDNSSGKKNAEFFIENIETSKITSFCISENETSFFISDTSKGFLYNLQGELLKEISFQNSSYENSGWNYIVFIDDFLVTCGISWVLNGYKIIEDYKKDITKKTVKDYSHFYYSDKEYFNRFSYLDKIDEIFTGNNRTLVLKKGNYGKKEIQITSSLISACNAYIDFSSNKIARSLHPEKSIFLRDSAGTNKIIKQLALMGTESFSELIALMIKSDDGTLHLLPLIKAAQECGYDPEGEITKALLFRLKTIPSSDSHKIIAICDAVYALCCFSGKNAFYPYGNELLKKLLYPQYSEEVRIYAKTILEKLADLKI